MIQGQRNKEKIQQDNVKFPQVRKFPDILTVKNILGKSGRLKIKACKLKNSKISQEELYCWCYVYYMRSKYYPNAVIVFIAEQDPGRLGSQRVLHSILSVIRTAIFWTVFLDVYPGIC